MVINSISLSYLCTGVEQKILKVKKNFTLFTQKIISPWDGGHEIHIFLSPYYLDALNQIW